jgi:hypothetical protein
MTGEPMIRNLINKVVVVVLLSTVLAHFAQALEVETPIKTTLCELVKTPEGFNGKTLTMRGHILIGFENFQLDLSDCRGGAIGNIWLEYGRGPKRQPTIWCCGDISPRDSLRLDMNRDFRAFHRYLTAQKRGEGCYEGECHLYDVTATLTGRFDLRPTVTCPDGKSKCPEDGGFGHFGTSAARLVIQSVSDVTTKPIDPFVYKKK